MIFSNTPISTDGSASRSLIPLTPAAVLVAFALPALAQQGAEACKTISRGVDRLECFDQSYGVERKLADPIPTVKVQPVTVTRERAPEIVPVRPVPLPGEKP